MFESSSFDMPSPNRVTRGLELGRPFADVLPGTEAHAVLLEDAPPVVHGVGGIAVREAEVVLVRGL